MGILAQVINEYVKVKTMTQSLNPLSVAQSFDVGAIYNTGDIAVDDDTREIRVTVITNDVWDNIKINLIYKDSSSTRIKSVSLYEGVGQFHFASSDVFPISTMQIEVVNAGTHLTQLRNVYIQKRRG